MFVWSFSIRKNAKYILVLALAAATVIFAAGRVKQIRTVPVAKSAYQGIADNEARRGFLRGYGWETTAETEETVAVNVPEQFDSVWNEYAELQRAQGFDIESLKGVTLVRYTYGVTNYDGEPEGTVKADLLMSGSTVVGGDICSLRSDGFIHGFEKPTDDIG